MLAQRKQFLPDRLLNLVPIGEKRPTHQTNEFGIAMARMLFERVIEPTDGPGMSRTGPDEPLNSWCKCFHDEWEVESLEKPAGDGSSKSSPKMARPSCSVRAR